MDIANINGSMPLEEYPWYTEVDKLLYWLGDKPSGMRAFFFDVVMSLAYVDATSGLEKHIQHCCNSPKPYNGHLGFINLCSPCVEASDTWVFQKAAKPQSGALGKLSSEVILRFISKFSGNIEKVLTVGGVDVFDAVLYHKNGEVILAEVKSAPMVTYPIVFELRSGTYKNHDDVSITASQLKDCNSALYLHNLSLLPMGKVGDKLWPFRGAVEFITSDRNTKEIESFYRTWQKIKKAYKEKDKSSSFYYVANASGSPPNIAKTRDSWPAKESISDSKTSAGMDRTDDIKKGIYQTLKIGVDFKNDHENIRTALISNLPAYRHGEEYVEPFVDMLWGKESELEDISGISVIRRRNLRRVFDYIITIEDPVLRGLLL